MEVEEEEGTQQNGAEGATVTTPPALKVARGSEQKDDVVVETESEAYVDAPSEPEDDSGDSRPDAPGPRRESTKSFVTASSIPNTADDEEDETESPQSGEARQGEQGQLQASGSQKSADQRKASRKSLGKRPLSNAVSHGSPASLEGGTSVDADSTSSLLRKADVSKAPAPAVVDPKPPSQGILARVKRRSEMRSSTAGQLEEADPEADTTTRKKSNLRNLVKFDIPEDSRRATLHLKAKKAQMTVQRAGTKIRRQRIKDGIVVKMERMLVRVDAAGEVPDEFDENVNQRVISRVKDKWREYMVVCRHSHKDDAEFVLQFYQTRVSLPQRSTIR